ncbi:chloride channel protein [Nibrella saemangeumensis]|uniref:Chloride channel protein n=1 Tax=Nibrella saemangeumensis TaxID=1084526 RepID=A0ABP8MTE1_9BACT
MQRFSLYQRLLSWLDRSVLRQLRSDNVRTATQLAIPFWIASIATGLIAYLYEKGFSWAEDVCREWLAGVPAMAFLITPVAFLLAWGLVYYLAPGARGSGIPQVMAALDLANPGHDHKVGYLVGIKVAVVKIISSILLLLGGGIIGREGPTIQIGASVFRWIAHWQPKNWPQLSRKVVLVTGGAAGLAAAFNTPLGGIVFVVEELTRTHITHFRTPVFTAVIIAGMTAQAFLGPYLYLGYPPVSPTGISFLGIASVTAACAGLAGAVFAKLLDKINSYRKRWSSTSGQVGWVFTCGLLFAGLIFLFGLDAMGTGKPLINRLLFNPFSHVAWYIFPVRLAGMVLSYSSGAAGGVFATSLSAGAILGKLLAGWLHVAPAHTTMVILVAMVSFLTGVARSPFTATILVVEMTDRNMVIFPLLVGALVAQLVATLVDSRSLYERSKSTFFAEALQQPGAPAPV